MMQTEKGELQLKADPDNAPMRLFGNAVGIPRRERAV